MPVALHGYVKSSLCLLLLSLAVAACTFDPKGITGEGNGDGGNKIDAGAPLADARTDGPADARVDANMSMPPDAATGLCGASCVLAGGTCTAGDVCTINCSGVNLCGGGVTCPAGVSCNVTCTGNNACQGGVTCTGASCVIKCNGVNACLQGVHCNGGSCSIDCRGDMACESGGVCCGGGGASCGNSCTSSMGGCCQCGGC